MHATSPNGFGRRVQISEPVQFVPLEGPEAEDAGAASTSGAVPAVPVRVPTAELVAQFLPPGLPQAGEVPQPLIHHMLESSVQQVAEHEGLCSFLRHQCCVHDHPV
jgi:hypothetical protein